MGSPSNYSKQRPPVAPFTFQDHRCFQSNFRASCCCQNCFFDVVGTVVGQGLASTKPLKPQDPPPIQPSSCQSGRKKFSRTIGLSPEPRATLHCRGVHKGSRMEEESLCVWSQPQALHHHHCRLHTWKPFHILPLLQDALHRLYFRA